MEHTVIGKYVTTRLHNYIRHIGLLIITWLVSTWLAQEQVLPRFLEYAISVELIIFAVVLIVKCNDIVGGYFSIKNMLDNSLIIEKRTVVGILPAPSRNNKPCGIVLFKNQSPMDCYMFDDNFEDYIQASEAYMIDAENAYGRIGIGTLPINKYTL